MIKKEEGISFTFDDIVQDVHVKYVVLFVCSYEKIINKTLEIFVQRIYIFSFRV